MSKLSLSKKYFFLCCSCVLLCVLVLGIVVATFSTKYFERGKYSGLRRSATLAADITAANFQSNNLDFVNEEILAYSYQALGEADQADFILVSLEGNILYFSNQSERDFETVTVPVEVIEQSKLNNYQDVGKISSLTDSSQYIVGVPILVNNQPVGILMAIAPATDLNDFLSYIIKLFALSGACVLLVAFVIIKFTSDRMTKPLKQMLSATKSFSQGDFARRVPVSSYDEIGQLAMAFNNMATSLASNESARRSFVASVSHELKTPMTTIGGFVDGILDGTIPPEKETQYLEVVSKEVKRLSRLVRSMLDTARIEAGEMEVNPVSFDVTELIRQSLFNFESKIDEKQVEIEGLETDHIMVLADMDLIHQVVSNLIDNAVKFVEDHGVISFFYRQENGVTSIVIRNTGEGMEKEEAEKIFERFYKLDRSRSADRSGVGLGLHITRTILQYHGSSIHARSIKGKYTEFEFSLPCAPIATVSSEKK